MDTIMDMTKKLSSGCFSLLLTDVARDNILFCSCWVFALAYYVGKMAPATNHNEGNFFMITYNV